jgi:hypothetical protein
MATSKAPETTIIVSPPRFGQATFLIEGNAPLVMLRFGAKAELMRIMAEEKAKGVKKERPPRDYLAEYEDAQHRAAEGWAGFPASAFRAMLIRTCTIVGFKMTEARMSLFTVAHGFDAEEGTPLVRITKGEPHMCSHHVRNANGAVDVRVRAMWDAGWQAEVTQQWDNDQFKLADVTNLISRAGMQVGLLEGRPSSKSSGGMGWGTFQIVEVTNAIVDN